MNAPTLTGTAGDARNDLAWNLVAGAVKTQVRRAKGRNFTTVYEGKARSLLDKPLVNDTSYRYKARGVDSKGRFGPYSSEVVLMPCAAPDAEPSVPPTSPGGIVGYGSGTTGGAGGTVNNVTTYAAFKTALLDSGPRIINITGSTVFDAGGDELTVTDGDLTIDGTGWTKSMKDYKLVIRASNILVTQVAFRPGEGATPSDSTDRRAISFNPPTGQTINRIVLDHCSFAWGPDVVASWLNNTEDVTAQFCIFGPALQYSNDSDHGSDGSKGYGITSSTAGEGAAWQPYYPKRLTWYRNLIIMCNKRNLRGESGDYVEMINNAVYDAGAKPGSGNFQHASLMGNMIKKGPESINNEGWQGELFGGVFTTYFPASIYFPVVGDTAVASHANIGINQGGGTFVPYRNFGGTSKRTTPYSTAPTNAALTTADEALFATVVAGAGRTHQDAIDTAIKAHANAGTSDGYYNGAGFSAPHPSW